MEKILNSNDRVRRAEEIYARRQNVRERTRRATVNVSEPKNFKLLKRIILQIIICALIYCIFYLINTTNYTFSKVTLEKTEGLLSNDMDFVTIYNSVADKIKEYFENIKPEEKGIGENAVEANNEQEEKKKEENPQETNEGNEISLIEDNEEKTGEENLEDVHISETDRIKRDYSFIIPIIRKNYIRVWRKRKYFKHSIYISQRNRYKW